MRTFGGLLRERAQRRPEAVAACFTGASWSSAELWERAERAGAGLAASGLAPGDHVLLLIPEVDDAIACLFGAWALGVVPVPLGFPYRVGDRGAFVDRLRHIARQVRARALVTSRTLAGLARADEALPVLAAEDIVAHDRTRALDPDAAPGPALIQLTSGTTGAPRGVVLGHERLLDHMQSMSGALPSHEASVAVSWLPLHHDMGLIGGLLFPLFNGFPVHLMSPAEFRSRPHSWLEAMSRHRATICAAPPSAYAMMTGLGQRALEAGWRFDAWECAMVGAEPIAAAVVRRFADAFAPVGFRAEAFFPVYGLAEATVAVTFPELLSATRFEVIDRRALEQCARAEPCERGAGSVELVGVGTAIPGTRLMVTAGDGNPLPERAVGELWVASTSLMHGYLDDPDATEAALGGGWLRTGNLGYLAGGVLFVTGRRKELIIRAGHNISPALVEEVVSEVELVRKGCVAAVGVHVEAHATDELHVIAETKAPAEQHGGLERAIRERLAIHGVAVDRVHLLAAGCLPKTTSGKIRRRSLSHAIAAGRSIAALEP